MKKIFSLLLFSVLLNINAQSSCLCTDNFNEWSLEFNIGMNKPYKTMTPGYYTSTPSLYHIDLGARYTFNPYIGIKGDIGYDSFKNSSKSQDFDTDYLRFDIQAVTDIGYALGIYDSKSLIGVLLHAGGGISQLNSDNNPNDMMVNFIYGITGTYKIAKKVSLSADVTGLMHAKQDLNFDGMSATSSDSGLNNNLTNVSVGVIYYFRR